MPAATSMTATVEIGVLNHVSWSTSIVWTFVIPFAPLNTVDSSPLPVFVIRRVLLLFWYSACTLALIVISAAELAVATIIVDEAYIFIYELDETVTLFLNVAVFLKWIKFWVETVPINVVAVPYNWIVPKSVPIFPLIVVVEFVEIVKFESALLAVPTMSCVLIVFVVPVLPRVKVTPSAKVASPPKVILPVEVSPIVAFAVTEIPVPLSPKVIVAVLEALTDPATFTELGASAVTPAVNVILSELPFPKVTNPVFENVTALVIVFEAPLKTTLYAWPAVFKVVMVALPLKVTLAASAVSVSVTVVTASAPEKLDPPDWVITTPAALTAVKEAVPVVLIVKTSKSADPPIVFEITIFPDPGAKVKSRAVSSLLIVLENVITSFEEVNVTSALKVTAPV